MRHGTTNRRSRSRNNNGRRTNSNKTRVFDSNGPDVRIRGTAYQINEKYLALAKDSRASGDYVMAESYLQHAEHYQRLINGWMEDDVDAKAKRSEKRSIKSSNDDKEDLGLPAGILGEAVRTSESADVNAISEEALLAV